MGGVRRRLVPGTGLQLAWSIRAPELVLRLLLGVLLVRVLLSVLGDRMRVLLRVLGLRAVVGVMVAVTRWVITASARNKAGPEGR